LSEKVSVGEYFYFLLHPRPVVLVVTRTKDGRVNVMACSWNTPVSEEPPMVALSIAKDSFTHRVIAETREFTVNIPTDELAHQVIVAGYKSGKTTDKLKLMKVSLLPAKRVSPPIIGECVGHIECKLERSVDAGETTLFLARVVEAYANEGAFQKGSWKLERVKPLQHVKGKEFTYPSKSFRAK